MVTDVVMPGLTGKELADRLKASRAGMKVLFTSGYTQNVIVHRGVLDAGVAYLPKPFIPEALAESVRETLGPALAAGTILVVDDEDGVRRLLAKILVGEGYSVLEAANGKEATQIVESRPVDLMITDLVMPEQEGIETVRRLSASHPKVKIIAMSGAFEGKFLATAGMLGAHATLAKPIDTNRLLRLVRELLN
jgi:CheY-like chemotaxis protein